MCPEILEGDLVMITIGLKNLKDHQEDLNLKKMNLKKNIRREDLAGGIFQELYPLLQQVEAGHLQDEQVSLKMTNLLEGEDRRLKIEIGNNQKQITLVRDEIHLVIKLKQVQDLE